VNASLRHYRFFILTAAIILLDQVIKLWVFYSFPFEGYEIPILGDWFKLNYQLNPGMAFGIKIVGAYGKLILTLFRWIASAVIAWVIIDLSKKNRAEGLTWSIALILGGALGNVMDSTFYGVLLNNQPVDSISPWFHGQVIDMFYIDICNCKMPDWGLPIFDGSYYPLWPVFNLADASIFVGVTWIIIKQKVFFPEEEKEEAKNGKA
jgi:signal peptidase II